MKPGCPIRPCMMCGWRLMASPCAQCWGEKSNRPCGRMSCPRRLSRCASRPLMGNRCRSHGRRLGTGVTLSGAVAKGRYRHMALGALHVSNDTRLFLGQHAIPSKSAETTEFRPFLAQLIADYAKTGLLEVISIDAGMVSQENAEYVVERGLDYIMALKGPQQVLFEQAQRWAQRESLPDKITP